MLAIIPAKAHSSRCPRKNLRQLAGIPLFLHSVSYALLEGWQPCVSTDSDEIISICRAHSIPFLREEIHEENLIHCMRQVAEAWPKENHFALLQPTSPFRTPGLLCRMGENLRQNPVQTLYTSTPIKPIGRFGDTTLCSHRDQDCPNFFQHFDGSILLTTRDALRQHDNLIGPWAEPDPQPDPLAALQIDTPEDFALATALATQARRRSLLPLHAGMQIILITNKRDHTSDHSLLVDSFDLVARVNGLESLDTGSTGSRTDLAIVMPGFLYLRRPQEELHFPALRDAQRVIFSRVAYPSLGPSEIARRAGLSRWSVTGPALSAEASGLTTVHEALLLLIRAFPLARIYALGDRSTLTRAPAHHRTAAKEDSLLQSLLSSSLLTWLNP